MLHDFLEDCVDDIIVKSKEIYNHINDLKEVFIRCRQCKFKTKHLKCAFGVFSEKFLG